MIDFIFASIDVLLNKRIRIRSIPYTDLIVAEKISEFSDQVFYTSDKSYPNAEFNEISVIEKDKDKYRIKVGNFYICRSESSTCGSTPQKNVCMDINNNRIDCVECETKAIMACTDNITLWDIKRVPLGYNIVTDNRCLTLGFRLKLTTCKETKDQLFGFEDYELISCLLNISLNKKPENLKDLFLMKNLSKLIDKLDDPSLKKQLKDKNEKEKDVNSFLKSKYPDIDNKPEMKRLWGNLWKWDYKRPSWNWRRYKLKMFCTKWW